MRKKKSKEKTKNDFRKDCEKVIKEAVEKKDEIIIATDPDREGEVIAKLILDKCHVPEEVRSRVWSCEGLDSAQINMALNMRKKAREYNGEWQKGIAQKESDWVFGINLSRAYSLILGETYSIGRVQTAVLREIYRNHCEILLFVPKKYYECRVTAKNGTFFYLQNPETKDIKFNGKEEIENLRLEKSRIRIVNEQKERVRKEVPQLYEIGELMSDAYRIYGIPVDRVMEKAQKLYNEIGVLSYPRTDCRYLSEEDEQEIRELYRKIKESSEMNVSCENEDEENLNEGNRRIFDSRKMSGHHALIPSNNYERSDTEEWKIWNLVERRFLMQGMKKYEYEKKKVYAQDEKGNVLIAEGKKDICRGWKELEPGNSQEIQEVLEGKNDECEIEKIEIIEKQTQPPKFYNEGTLIEFMKNPYSEESEEVKRLGTQATQAQIVKTLFERGYVRTEKKHIEITDKGITLCERIMDSPLLDKHTRVEATVMWDKINSERPELLRENIEKVTVRCVEELRKEMMTSVEKTEICDCPGCGGKICRGKASYYCSGYKEGCENHIAFKVMGNDIDEQMVREIFTSGKSKVMKGKKKDGEDCSFYFRTDESGKVVMAFENQSGKVCTCPDCGKDVVSMNKTYKCTSAGCGFFLYKESYGISYQKEDIGKLIDSEEEIRKTMTKKDGKRCEVSVRFDREEGKLKVRFM